MAQGHVSPHAGSRREPEYRSTTMDRSWEHSLSEQDVGLDWTGLDFNMEQKLWTLAFVLALWKTRVSLFHGGTDGDGTLGSQEGNPLNFTSSIKSNTEPHPPVQVWLGPGKAMLSSVSPRAV